MSSLLQSTISKATTKYNLKLQVFQPEADKARNLLPQILCLRASQLCQRCRTDLLHRHVPRIPVQRVWQGSFFPLILFLFDCVCDFVKTVIQLYAIWATNRNMSQSMFQFLFFFSNLTQIQTVFGAYLTMYMCI